MTATPTTTMIIIAIPTQPQIVGVRTVTLTSILAFEFSLPVALRVVI
jgi:hypothetical protein